MSSPNQTTEDTSTSKQPTHAPEANLPPTIKTQTISNHTEPPKHLHHQKHHKLIKPTKPHNHIKPILPPPPMPPSPGHRQRGGVGPHGSDLPSSKILFGKYQVGRLLGCGAFAKVYHARDLRTNANVAIKCINKLLILKSNLVPNVKREILVMRRLRHPNIVHLIEVLASRTKIYFIMEFVKGGELFSRIAKGRLSEDLSRKYFQELISAVAFCHSRGVFHRDLKPENLLLDEFGKVKVSDFGLSAVSDQLIRPDEMFHTLCGTPAYVAPEILAKRGYDGAKVDIWSCGVILFVLNAGFLPFNDPNLMQMYRKIYRGEYKFPRWTSPELRGLISRLLDTNPRTRITVEEIFKDSWFRKGLDEEKMRAVTSFQGAPVEERISNPDIDGETDRELNAFDIISLSSGFDLSGLFDGKTERTWFVSSESGEAVLERLEEVGRGEGLVVRRMKGKVGRRGVAVEGQNGNLVAWVEVHKLSSELVMVEVEKGSKNEGGEDDLRWNSEFWKEKLGPMSEPTTPVSRGGRKVGLTFDMIGAGSEPVSSISDFSEVEPMDSGSESEPN